MKQRTLTGFEKFAKTTRRARFLADMDRIIQWKELTAAVESVYPKGSEAGGRPSIPLERMLRIWTVCCLNAFRHRAKLRTKSSSRPSRRSLQNDSSTSGARQGNDIAVSGGAERPARGAYVLVLSCVLAIFYATTSAGASTSAPLLDRTLFLAELEITAAQISPDGKLLAFLKPFRGVQNIWIKRTDEQLTAARPVAAGSDHSALALYWSNDSRFLLFTRDSSGNGKVDLFAVRADGITVSSGEPKARNLTGGMGTPAMVLALPEVAPDVVYVGLNGGQPPQLNLYAVDIATGKRTLLRRNDLGAVGWVFDLAGKPRLAIRTGKYGQFELVRLDAAGPKLIYDCWWSETCNVLQFDPDGWHVYLASNHGESVDKVRLVSLDIRDGHEEVVASDPEQEVDLDETVFSPHTHRPTATVYEGDAGLRYAWRDPSMQADFRRLQARLSGRKLRLQPAADGRDWLIFASSDSEPGEAYLFDRPTGALTLQYRLTPSLPRAALAQMTAIRYPSADGLEIHAYLTLPRGVTPRSLPLLVVPHEGPWNVRDAWGYSNLAQFFANRGFAVLQPNFRGSVGYGKRFLKAGDRQWGKRVQDDITWGVRRLVATGIADPKRVAIFGMSYGGYAALAGAAFTPDLYVAAVDMCGPSDLVLLSESAVFKSARVLFDQSVGDPSTPEGKADLERQSPINSADKIETPLLIIQGALDPVVVQAQSDRVVAALRQRHAPVTYLLAKDEGHVLGPGHLWGHPLNNLAVFAEVEKFLGQTVGTRYQRDMTPEAMQRLKELTVPAD